jgi:hypothetical protein
VLIRELVQRLALRVVVDGDCNMGYRDPSRNPMGSLAEDMIRIAFVRRQCGGSRLDARAQEIGHMWRRPLKC